MSDAAPERRTTGEVEETVQATKKLANKWVGIAALIVVSGSAGGVLRNCLGVGAGLVGLQTEVHAKEQQTVTDDRHKSHEAANIESHNELWKTIGKIEKTAQQAVDNSQEMLDSRPDSWKKRAKKLR